MTDPASAIAAISSNQDGIGRLLSAGIEMIAESGLLACEPVDLVADLKLLEADLDEGRGAGRLASSENLRRLAAGAIEEAMDERRLMARLPVEAGQMGTVVVQALRG